jgi:hypothetical protein
VSESLESAVERFLEHKRALGRKYHSEEHELRCSSASPASAGPAARPADPSLLEDFLGSRPRV